MPLRDKSHTYPCQPIEGEGVPRQAQDERGARSPNPLPSRERGSFDGLRTNGGVTPTPPIEGEWVLRQAQDERGARSPQPSPIKGEGVLRQAQDERGRGGFWAKHAIAAWCGEGSGWITFAATVG